LNHRSQTFKPRQQRRILAQAANADAYGFFNLLTGPELLKDVEGLLPEHRERLFPPTETLSIFLAQVLSADGGCRQAVNDTAVKRLVAGMDECSPNTSAFCKARARLPQTRQSRHWRCAQRRSSPMASPTDGSGGVGGFAWPMV
jgi:hypothetical protein